MTTHTSPAMVDAPPRPAVLITGAATGIGAATVQQLAARGYHVFAGVRKSEDGAALQAHEQGQVTPLLLDVTDATQIAAAQLLVTHQVGAAGLVGLVNNAGIAVGGPLEFLPLNELRYQMEVNVYGALAVTQTFLPLLRQATGRIINISSISGLASSPFLGPYAASKYALEALSDALRLELRPWGLKVVLIEPGAIATPIWQKGLMLIDRLMHQLPPEAQTLYGPIFPFMRARLANTKGIAVERVAECIVHALITQSPKARYLVGNDTRLRLLIEKLPTHWRDQLVAGRMPTYGPPTGTAQRVTER